MGPGLLKPVHEEFTAYFSEHALQGPALESPAGFVLDMSKVKFGPGGKSLKGTYKEFPIVF